VRATPALDTLGSLEICTKADAQFGPAVAFNGTDYVVVWADRRFSGAYWWITAARVTTGGAVLDSGIPLGAADAHNEFYPDVAFDGSRTFAVWYHSYYPPWGIYGRFISAAALPEDTVVCVAPTRTHVANSPKVAAGDSGLLVVWADLREGGSDYDVFGRLMSRQGEPLTGVIAIGTGEPDQTRPDVVFAGGRYLVVWAEAGAIRGQELSDGGGLVGPGFAVSDTAGFARATPRLAAGAGYRLAVWSERRGAGTDIYASISGFPGVDEELPAPSPARGRVSVTSRVGTLAPGNSLYDAQGRKVVPEQLRSGLYFLRSGTGDAVRLVLIR